MVAKFQFKHHITSLLFARLFACFASPSIIYDSNPWAIYMVWKVCRKLHKVTLHGTWTSCGMYFICTMNTSYRINFSIASKSMCIYLFGDSNTKCTHLGGVHPIGCDFETNMFTSLSSVVSHGVNTIRECFSRSMWTNNSIRVIRLIVLSCILSHALLNLNAHI